MRGLSTSKCEEKSSRESGPEKGVVCHKGFHHIILFLDRSEGAVRQKRVDSGRSCHATGDDATSSEEEDDQGGIENEDDGQEDNRGDALSTPHSKIRPAFSSSQTPCEGVVFF